MPERTNRKIALIDLDAYFCSAETLKDPSLKDVPFAVGGRSGRGVISTANYIARQFGVRSAMPSQKAFQLCPELKILASDMAFYKQLSGQIEAILLEFTDQVERASIDEFYLDLTDTPHFKGSASLTVAEIRRRIAELGVTASAGVSPLRMVSKIASDDNKPNGQTLIAPDQVFEYLKNLDLKRIPGVGKVTLAKLNDAGFHLGEDVQQADLVDLARVIGKNHASLLQDRCNGIDPRGISLERERKSVAAEITLEQNIDQLSQAQTILKHSIVDKFQQRIASSLADYHIKNQTVKLKFDDFNTTTLTQQVPDYTPQLFATLLDKAWKRRDKRKIRLIGVAVGLEPKSGKDSTQLDLF